MLNKLCRAVLTIFVLFLSQINIAAAQTFQDGMQLENLVNHLKIFQQIADQNTDLPGTRFPTTKGYDDTRDYIMQKLQEAGYEVKLQYVPIEVSYVTSPRTVEQVAPTAVKYVDHVDYAPLMNSGGADVTASVQIPRDEYGCAADAFADFKAGNIALLQLGQCHTDAAVNLAIAAGAKAVMVHYAKYGVMYFAYHPAQFKASNNIPVLVVSEEVSKALHQSIAAGVVPEMHVNFNAVHKYQASQNIIAESREGDADHVVMMGAHIDSTTGNSGMNDNASAVATVLETVLLMKDIKPVKKLRFAFWTGEEMGLMGSNYYIEHLTAAEIAKISVYFNFEDLGAPNGGRMIMDTAFGITPKGSGVYKELYKNYFKSQHEKYFVFTPLLSNAYKRSDMFAFARAGIPVSFISSGANIKWNPLFTLIFSDLPGRVSGLDMHPCYHKFCDTLTLSGGEYADPNFDFNLYLQMSKAAAFAVYTTAMKDSS